MFMLYIFLLVYIVGIIIIIKGIKFGKLFNKEKQGMLNINKKYINIIYEIENLF